MYVQEEWLLFWMGHGSIFYAEYSVSVFCVVNVKKRGDSRIEQILYMD